MIDRIKENKRPLLMLVAMVGGVIFHRPITAVDTMLSGQAVPAFIFAMLFVTFCSVRIRDLRLSPIHLVLISIQLIAPPVVYYLLLPAGEIAAQGVMVCFLTPIAMGAVAVGAMLGANVTIMVTYTLLCNLVLAFVAPIYLDLFGNGECTFAEILSRVVPLLLAPLVVAQIFKRVCSRGAQWVGEHSYISFYIWLFTMFFVLSRTTRFVIENRSDITPSLALILLFGALVACLLQYGIGRFVGSKIGDNRIAGAQSLGQKNTALAVWLAQSFLSPLSSIAPAAYVVWQNMVNSYQIYRHDKIERSTKCAPKAPENR